MAIKRPIVVQKTRRKTAAKQLKARSAPFSAAQPAARPNRLGHSILAAFLQNLRLEKPPREYQTGGSIFSQGDYGGCGLLRRKRKGKANGCLHRGKGSRHGILPEGSFFGEGCLAGQPLRMATATAMQRSTITRVKRRRWSRCSTRSRNSPSVLSVICFPAIFASKKTLVDQLFNSSEKRLARLLLLLANFGHESKPIPVVAKISQETLAEMIGTTRSRVSFFMNRFRKMGFVDYNGGGMQIHSSLVSVVLHD